MNTMKAIALALLAVQVWPGRATVVDVSPGGDVRSLRAARDRVRALRAGGETGTIEVVFADGTYRFSDPVAFDGRDSGTDAGRTVYRAQHRGKAVFSGGIELDWRPPSSADRMMARVPMEARRHVRVARVPDGVPLNGFGGGRCFLNERPLWLYSSGCPLPVASWPNAAKSWLSIGDEFARVREAPGESVILSDPERVRRWEGEPDLWVYGMWSFDWDDSVTRVLKLDAATGRVELDRAAMTYPATATSSFRVLNAFAELDEPGEWAVDRPGRTIYAWLAGAPVKASAAEAFVTATNLSNVVFEGFVFEHVRGDALRFDDCRRVGLVASEVREVGGYAAVFDGCKSCRIAGCDLHNLGEGGVLMSGGDRTTLTPGRNVAVNNHVFHYGERLPFYRPGIGMGSNDSGHKLRPSVGNRVEHNLIHHSRHFAVSFRGNDDYIGFNVIHDTCRWTVDAGPIYGYSDNDWTVARGTLIEHNVVYANGKRPHPKQCFGIYVDGIVSGVTVRGNLVIGASYGLYQNGGQANVYDHNLIAVCNVPLERRDLGYTNPATRPDSEAWKRLQTERAMIHGEPWRSRYPELVRQSDIEDAAWAQCSLFTAHSNNVCAASGSQQYANGNLKGLYAVTNNLDLSGDPGFVDYAHFDWNLRPDSPARAVVGDLRFDEAGLFADPWRLSPPVKFGPDVTQPGPMKLTHAPAEVRIDILLPGRTFTAERPMATGLEGCRFAGPWCKERNRICGVCEGQPFGQDWRTFRFSFVPAESGEYVFDLSGAFGGKTCYDDFHVQGGELKEPGFEADGVWATPTPSAYVTGMGLSDCAPPYGITEGDRLNRPAQGRRFAVSTGQCFVTQRVKLTAGVRFEVSFKARALTREE